MVQTHDICSESGTSMHFEMKYYVLVCVRVRLEQQNPHPAWGSFHTPWGQAMCCTVYSGHGTINTDTPFLYYILIQSKLAIERVLKAKIICTGTLHFWSLLLCK